MADRRPPLDFPDRSGLSAGTQGAEDAAKGFVSSNIQSFDSPPEFDSPGLHKKKLLGDDGPEGTLI